MRVFRVFFVLLAASTVLASNGGSENFNVHVQLRAPWESISHIQEMSEFLADVGAEKFWAFIDRVSKHSDVQYSDAEKIGQSLLGNGDTLASKFMLLSVANREHSPRVEMFRQMAREHALALQTACDGPVWSTIIDEPRPFCSVAELQTALEALHNKPTSDEFEPFKIFDLDHIYNKTVKNISSNGNLRTVILYADIRSNQFAPFHSLLSQYASSGKILYALRHSSSGGSKAGSNVVDSVVSSVGAGSGSGSTRSVMSRDPLMGYGVELAIKSMEYKAVDDQKKGDDSNLGISIDAEEEVEGFYFSKLIERKPDLTKELSRFRDELLADRNPDRMLKAWEMKDLGIQATQRILTSDQPLKLLQEISQNFPQQAYALSRLVVNKKIKQEVESNHKKNLYEPGQSLLLLNGKKVDVNQFNLFKLLEDIRMEIHTATQLHELGLSNSQVKRLLSLPPQAATSYKLNLKSYMGRKSTNEKGILFLNNIEKDAKYKNWSPNLYDLMYGWPNQIKFVRKNLHTVTGILDLSDKHSWQILSSFYHAYEANLPLRFSVVLSTRSVNKGGVDDNIPPWPEHLLSTSTTTWKAFTEPFLTDLNQKIQQNQAKGSISTHLTRGFLYIFREYGASDALRFADIMFRMSSNTDKIDSEEQAIRAFDIAIGGSSKKPKNKKSYAEASRSTDYDADLKAFNSFSDDFGFSQLPTVLFNGNNIKDLTDLAVGLRREITVQQQRLQTAIHMGQLHEHMDLTDFYYNDFQGGILLNRANNLILDGIESSRFISLESCGILPSTVKPVSEMNLEERFRNGLVYMHKIGSKNALIPISHWLVVDPSTIRGIDLILAGIERLSKTDATVTTNSRIAVVFNPSDSTFESGRFTFQVIEAVLKTQPIEQVAMAFLKSYLSSARVVSYLNQPHLLEVLAKTIAKEISGFKFDQFIAELEKSESSPDMIQHLNDQREFSQKVLRLAAGAAAVVTNGRVIELGVNSLAAADVTLLEMWEMNQRLTGVQDVVSSLSFSDNVVWESVTRSSGPDFITTNVLNDLQLVVSSIRNKYLIKREPTFTAVSPHLDRKHTSLIYERDSPLQLDVILDPLSESAQVLSPIILTLFESLDLSLAVYFMPKISIGDYPIKRWYRFAIASRPTLQSIHDSTQQSSYQPTSVVTEGGVLFHALPTKHTLTMAMDTPESWLVAAAVAVHDLDNIRLEDVGAGKTATAVYLLKNIIVTGQCLNRLTESAVNSLELMLATPSRHLLSDTVVMLNLGYFQLKANPGRFIVDLPPNTPSEDIYQVVSRIPTKDVTESREASLVHVTSFNGQQIQLRVDKRVGKESMSLLEEGGQGDNQGGFFGSLWGNKKQHDYGDTIHVFSVASGHLYERFLRIMMLSVTRNTKSKVKFWLIEQFLSPKFKDFIPHMAEAHGFEVGFVTYKWPDWLHKQTQKQRIIWAYKILFLDTLFPLSVKKVIFIDADQVVRSDIKELWDMDLQGKPYGYTPFCDSNKDTEGFRFWKQGYWSNHLSGLKYHISALYVVDLIRFRAMAAGDNLRMFYDNLSKDPNSLANLDQDLPNYAQHRVPIFSLPQHWLWCETWCDQTSKKSAKTIDLCNNPLTKEPKLSAAKRIIPEWVQLDNDARADEEKYVAGTLSPLHKKDVHASPKHEHAVHSEL